MPAPLAHKILNKLISKYLEFSRCLQPNSVLINKGNTTAKCYQWNVVSTGHTVLTGSFHSNYFQVSRFIELFFLFASLLTI